MDVEENENSCDRGRASQYELEFYRKAKKLAERELDLARRKIEFLRRSAAESVGGPGPKVTGALVEGPRAVPRISVNVLADLLSYFDGNVEKYDSGRGK